MEAQSSLNDIEISPEAGVCVESIAQRLSVDGGMALIADYGHLGDKGDTFRVSRIF